MSQPYHLAEAPLEFESARERADREQRVALQRRIIAAVRDVSDTDRYALRHQLCHFTEEVEPIALAALAAACVDAKIWDALCHVRQVHLADEEENQHGG